MKIAFVCVNYNGKEDTLKWFNSISGQRLGNPKIVVVDFTSDFSIKEDRFVVLQSENIGYFAGLNLGLEYIKKCSDIFDFIVAGNNDILFNQSIKSLKSLKKLESYIISPRITKPDGKEQNPHVKTGITSGRRLVQRVMYSSFIIWVLTEYVRRYILSNGLFRRDQRTSYLSPGYIYMGHGSCFILTKKYIKEFGVLPNETFLYGEEAFLREQLKYQSNAWFYFPKMHVIHNEHSSTSKIARKELYLLRKNAMILEIRKLNSCTK